MGRQHFRTLAGSSRGECFQGELTMEEQLASDCEMSLLSMADGFRVSYKCLAIVALDSLVTLAGRRVASSCSMEHQQCQQVEQCMMHSVDG